MRLTAALAAVLIWCASVAATTATPNVEFKWRTHDSDILQGALVACSPSAPALVIHPSNVFLPIRCTRITLPPVSMVMRLDLIERTSEVNWAIKGDGPGFETQAIEVSSTQALVYTSDPANSVLGMVASYVAVPVWRLDRHNATSSVAYDAGNQVAFVTMGSHGPVGARTLRAVYALDGSTKWERSFGANASLGTPIFYPFSYRVLMLHDGTLSSFDAETGLDDLPEYKNPCGVTAMAGRTLSLEVVQYAPARGAKGPLSALLLYGMTTEGRYTVCRLHDSGSMFGMADWVHNGPYSTNTTTISAITGGGGHLFVSLEEEQGPTYRVAVLNAFADPSRRQLKLLLSRDGRDRESYPAALLHPTTGGHPIMVLQLDLRATAYRLYGDYGLAWQLPEVHCAMQPPVLTGESVSRAICVGLGIQMVVEVDYFGVVIWTYKRVLSSYPAQIYQDTTVFLQTAGLTGLSFYPATDGPSPGVVVLIVLVILLSVALGVAIWKVVRSRAARKAVETESIDREGCENIQKGGQAWSDVQGSKAVREVTGESGNGGLWIVDDA